MSCDFNPEILDVWRAGSSCSSGQPVDPSFIDGPQQASLDLPLPWGVIPVTTSITYTQEGVNVSFNGQGLNHTEIMAPRYRRSYDDWTLTEQTTFKTDVIGPDNQIVEVTFDLEFKPVCRLPDLGFCGTCLDPNVYNVIDLSTLNTYPLQNPRFRRVASFGGSWAGDYEDGLACPGKPIDIDVVCGSPLGDTEGDKPIDGGVTMFFAPRETSAVPVINNVVYDTTQIPRSSGGKQNVVKIITLATRNAIRDWTCVNLSFATVTGSWPPGLGSSGSSGASPDDSLTFNWPYNDLYFSKCPEGNYVNLIPC